MSLLQRSAIVTAMFAALSVPAFAQSSAAPAADQAQAAHAQHHRPDPQARQARMGQRMQALKAALKLNASQEAAWNDYSAALQPQPHAAGERPAHPDRKAFAAMTTPERIDAMQALHSKRQADQQARMDRRHQATKTFYATLSPEQQKTFDAETLQMHERHGKHSGRRAQPSAPVMDSK